MRDVCLRERASGYVRLREMRRRSSFGRQYRFDLLGSNPRCERIASSVSSVNTIVTRIGSILLSGKSGTTTRYRLR